MAKRKAKGAVAPKKIPKSSGKKPEMGLAVAALIINLIIPGIGSIIGGRVRTGLWQFVLAIVGGVLSIILIGIPIAIAAWIWALVTGIQLIQAAQ